MKQYNFVIDKAARKFIETQQKKQRNRIFAAIYKLPHEGDRKPLAGRKGYFRLSIGGYRVIYTVRHDIITVAVLEAGNRGDVYK